jgi:omega-3 fatty acid desaturase (delta-15 desaturase)
MVGTTALLVQYFAPLLVFASWLVLTTFLHHHDEAGVPWFADDEWSYVRGNLSSVDRSFGTVLDELTHNIATHQGGCWCVLFVVLIVFVYIIVVHHLFPK